MRKLVIALLALALLIPSASAAAGKASAKKKRGQETTVILRDAVIVDSKLVRLGDLFAGAGDKADIAVAYAPAPGQRAVFDARWLFRAARAYGLKWRPLGLQDQTVVERESQVIPRDEIEDHIRAALIDKGADPSMRVELSNRMMRLYVPGDARATVGVEETAYEPRTGRFTAILAAPAGDPAATRTRVTGRIHRVTDVPVPTRRLLANEVVAKGDIKWVEMRNDRLPRGTVVDVNELVGMAAKRGLRAGIPIQANAIQRPILVPKGSLVTIILKTPKMTLTAQGKALDNGSDGDTIRITNTRSKKVIEAEVTGTGRVAVLVTSQMAMN